MNCRSQTLSHAFCILCLPGSVSDRFRAPGGFTTGSERSRHVYSTVSFNGRNRRNSRLWGQKIRVEETRRSPRRTRPSKCPVGPGQCVSTRFLSFSPSSRPFRHPSTVPGLLFSHFFPIRNQYPSLEVLPPPQTTGTVTSTSSTRVQFHCPLHLLTRCRVKVSLRLSALHFWSLPLNSPY